MVDYSQTIKLALYPAILSLSCVRGGEDPGSLIPVVARLMAFYFIGHEERYAPLPHTERLASSQFFFFFF